MIVVAGIDPGLAGGAAVLGDGFIESCLLPTVEGVRGREIDTATLARWLTDRDVTDCAVEMAQPMPTQGIVTAFNYGMSYGAILGTLRAARIEHHPVHPIKWKRHHNLLKTDKLGSLERARKLWPSCGDQFARMKDQHRAEAAMMAVWLKGVMNDGTQ